ncbi:MAG TPA: Mur ligase domain-containing protein, partial [Candidatus Brocadiaceae bacterium]|nr:Mur ligase domain-containing protein [Candidatus Brocadiaceae bacterium]
MEILECEEVARATNGKTSTDTGKALKISGISRDSKSVKPGDLFVAIKGERHDGHDYIEQAMNAGAVGAVVSRDIVIKSRQEDFTVIRVNDTVTALGALAKYYRRKLGAKIVGITGSNGKTTTKEMVSHLLSCFGPTARS